MPRIDNSIELRENIRSALQSFEAASLHDASIALLKVLGYSSDKTIEIPDSDSAAFLKLLAEYKPDIEIDKDKALFNDWLKADLLFQLTDEELSNHGSLFKDDSVSSGLLQSYLFLCIELNQRDYARGKLTAIARQLNRVFPMPVMVFIKHSDLLSIAVINRRVNKRDAEKDVLGKVTIIRDISLASPHRGHLDILDSFALPSLSARTAIYNFDTLHAAWEEVFNVELLNKRFYKELANWYFWALREVDFPDDMKPAKLTRDEEAGYYEKLRATGLIRLLTRIIFCWFLKEKGLIPEALFDRDALQNILNSLEDDKTTYHQAILQNLFFATLNQRMNARGEKYRIFAKDEGFLKNRNTYGVDNLYRYESLFKDQEAALEVFEDIPFLNGGLFECLDRTDEKGRKIYVDGFSRNRKKRPNIPNRLFFGEGEIDIGAVTGEKRRGKEKAKGLIQILSGYKFTIVENTPIDQEIALDPELLGKVFENLLASYNEETKTTARKQTGSFYTPRPIVDYMVDESLKAHLVTALGDAHGMTEEDACTGLYFLFAYTEREHPFEENEVDTLIKAIDTCKILDPACGSGAFPMGVLHKLVYILTKLDRDNTRWKQTQLNKLDSVPMREELERTFENNNDDYGRKLYLIENCLYGVDIQPIAIQLCKLRFFISLICDQRTSRNKAKNHGIKPLPNLETKFVAADTLIQLGESVQMELFKSPKVINIEEKIQKVRHDYFAAQKRKEKLALQEQDNELRNELANELMQASFADQETSHKLAKWNPYDPHTSAVFFDPLWMFDQSVKDGFDIIVQNPPYVSHDRLKIDLKSHLKCNYDSWDPFGDIYCYFLEKAHGLLSEEGVSCSITSNSFLRSEYGAPLRGLLNSQAKILQLISLDESQVFQNAIVNVAILLFSRKNTDRKEAGSYLACKGSLRQDFRDFVHENCFYSDSSTLSRKVWSLSNDQELFILERIESLGIPLDKTGAKIRLGLATGDNRAFLISLEQKECYVREEPDNEKILKPVLRGRGIDRFTIGDPPEFLILSKNGVNLPKDYPILSSHLESFGDEFKARGAKGQEWWNLRACSFYEDFEKDKIVWIELTNQPRFAVCPPGIYLLNSAYFLLPPKGFDAHALAAFFNSKICEYYATHTAQTSGMGTMRWIKALVSKLPIPNLNDIESENLGILGRIRSSSQTQGMSAEIKFLEDLIDACVMEIYFSDHMAVHDLLFNRDVCSLLDKYDQEISEPNYQKLLVDFCQIANAPDHPIRNRLLRLTAESPDLLAVIKENGMV